jgi:hypothetical protein
MILIFSRDVRVMSKFIQRRRDYSKENRLPSFEF